MTAPCACDRTRLTVRRTAQHISMFRVSATIRWRRCTRTLVCFLLLFSCLLTGCATALAQEHLDPLDPPQGRFDDAWMAVMISGVQMGYVHVENLREGDRIHTSTHMVMKIRRAGTALEISMQEGYTETIDGKPLGFESKQLMAGQPVMQRGTIQDDKVHVESEQFGIKNKQVIDFPEGALMPWAAYRKQSSLELGPGTVIELDMYMPSVGLNISVPTRTEILEKSKVDLLGREVPAYRTKTTTKFNNIPIEAEGWLDEDWKPLKETMNMMGLEIVMIACDKATALKDIQPAEMFLSSLIPIHKSLDRDKARSITFKLSVDPSSTLPDLPHTDMQRVVSRSDNVITLQVSRSKHDDLVSAASQHEPGPELAPFLGSTLYITRDDPKVRELALAAVGDEKNPYRQAVLLRKKVSETISTVGLGTAFATAAEVCRTRAGDCTENGVLLAALGRVVGIPSRVVTGMIYVRHMSGRKDIMGFHMWTQFWIGGRWIDMDAAWDQDVADATHIALGTHSTEEDSVASLVSSVLIQLDELKITVLDVE